MLVILHILNDDLHVHHMKHISTSSGCTYDMAHSIIYVRPCARIYVHTSPLLVKTWPLTFISAGIIH